MTKKQAAWAAWAALVVLLGGYHGSGTVSLAIVLDGALAPVSLVALALAIALTVRARRGAARRGVIRSVPRPA